jgi:hypothetical protein
MTRLCSYVGVAVFALCSLAYAQAAKLSDQDFKKVAQSHSTADEHQTLAAHYTAHAVEHENDAKVHEDLATLYLKSEPKLVGETRHYAAHSREAAEALRSLAKLHQELAKEHAAKK